MAVGQHVRLVTMYFVRVTVSKPDSAFIVAVNSLINLRRTHVINDNYMSTQSGQQMSTRLIDQ